MAPFQDENRWPPLLVALRRSTRPDRARVAAYVSLFRRPAGWDAYAEFLTGHRAWLDALDRALARSGTAHRPLRDGAGAGADPTAAIAEIPAPRSRAHALGYLYVYEAFRLGCEVLARRIRGLAALEPASSDAGRPWDELVVELGRVPIAEHATVVQGALEAFAGWERSLGPPLARLGLAPSAGRAA